MTTTRKPLVGFGIVGLCLVATGCNSAQSHNRVEAKQRWNEVRADVKLRLAADQLSAGHFEDAAAEVGEAYRLNPTDPQVLILQARVHMARGDQRSARRVLQAVDVPNGPVRAEVEYLLGTIAQQCMRWDDAFGHFVQAADNDPQDVVYVVAIVQSLLQLDRPQKAATFLQSYDEQFGWTAAYQAALAECQEQLGEWNAAAACWKKVVATDDAPELRERLATALFRAERYVEAAPQIARLIDDAGTSASSAWRLMHAQCLLETRRTVKARQELSLVLRSAPDNVAALRLLACALAREGRLMQAISTAERAYNLAPDEMPSQELLATLALRTGDTDRAVDLAQHIQTAHAEQNSPVAREILARATSHKR